MPISMSSVWDESVAMIRKERHLLVPLALATIGVGSAISGYAQPKIAASESVALATFGFIVGTALSLIGNLAVMALALTPGLSVGDALHTAVARLPKFLGIIAVFALAISILMIPLILVLAASGVNEKMAMSELPPAAALCAFASIAVIFYFGARLITLNAVVVDRNPPIIESIKSSFAITRALTAKIIGVTILYIIVAVVIGGATSSIFGLAFNLIGKAIGSPVFAPVMSALVNGMVSALLSIVSTIFVATLYRRLSAQ